LISQIHAISPNSDKMNEVFASSKSVDVDADNDMEINIDELDTYTLRRLQKLVDDGGNKKKRPVTATTTPRSSIGAAGPAPKKTKTEEPSSSSNHIANDVALFDDSQLLFDTALLEDPQHAIPEGE